MGKDKELWERIVDTYPKTVGQPLSELYSSIYDEILTKELWEVKGKFSLKEALRLNPNLIRR